jgi:catechol-2,3-dioxygenase
MRLTNIGHCGLNVVDLDRALAFYRDVVGLHVTERDGAAAYLRCGAEHHCLSLHKAPQGGLHHIAFETPGPAGVDEAERELAARGTAVSAVSGEPGHAGRAIQFLDPEGRVVQIHPPMKRAGAGREPKGILLRKMGHLNLKVVDLFGMTDYYHKVLGMKISDWRRPAGSWLRVNPDHHGVGMVRTNVAGLHHTAFEVADWGEIRAACDWLAGHGVHLEHGPLRHGPGGNISIYFFDSDGIRVEIFCEIIQIWDDASYVPNEWPLDPPNFDVWTQSPPPAPSWTTR